MYSLLTINLGVNKNEKVWYIVPAKEIKGST